MTSKPRSRIRRWIRVAAASKIQRGATALSFLAIEPCYEYADESKHRCSGSDGAGPGNKLKEARF